jgi:hypothetical protein
MSTDFTVPSMHGRCGMFPITSFTASIGYAGLIDISAVAVDPDSEGGTVRHARQIAASGAWSPWSDEGTPGVGAVGVRSIVDAEGTGMSWFWRGRALWFKEHGPADDFSGWQPPGRPPARASSARPV